MISLIRNIIENGIGAYIISLGFVILFCFMGYFIIRKTKKLSWKITILVSLFIILIIFFYTELIILSQDINYSPILMILRQVVLKISLLSTSIFLGSIIAFIPYFFSEKRTL